jgi:hypothetical protein
MRAMAYLYPNPSFNGATLTDIWGRKSGTPYLFLLTSFLSPRFLFGKILSTVFFQTVLQISRFPKVFLFVRVAQFFYFFLVDS